MPYGTANVDTIQSSTANTPVQFKDGNGTQVGTLYRAWVNINGASGASPTIRASFNFSSVTRNSTGNYTAAFTNAMSDANYSAVIGLNGRSSSGTLQLTVVDTVTNSTGNVAFTTYGTPNGGSVGVASSDSGQINVSIFR